MPIAMTLFAPLATLLELLALEPGRLKKRAAIAEALAAVHAASPNSNDAGLFALYLSGTPFAESDPRKLNAGGALLSRAVVNLAEATGPELTAAYRRHGDLGAAAFDLLTARDQAKGLRDHEGTLTVAEIAEAFAAMASARTTATRAAQVDSLLRRATPLEAKYLLKLMLGDMRTGVKQSLVEEAIAQAASTAETPIKPAEVRHAIMLEADIASATQRAFTGTLAEARMRLFHPLGFMLASPVASAEEAIERFTGEAIEPTDESSNIQPDEPVIEALLEDKYDGMRAQLHLGDPTQPGRVALYSRNREDVTASYPELAEAFARVPASIGPLILDGEILAWNYDGTPDNPAGHALPFAILGFRIGRKRVPSELRARVPVLFMAFDLLYHCDSLTLNLPLTERRSRLESIAEQLTPYVLSPIEIDDHRTASEAAGQPLLFAPESTPHTNNVPRLILSPARMVESAADIDRAYLAARARSNEGVMIKAAGSHYLPGRRGLAWVKLKRELATLDVVITGAEYGHGRRAGSLSDYTFAVRGPAYQRTGELLNVGKAYSGLTDTEIAELTAFLKAHTLEDHGHFRTVEPLVILEVAFNNIMRSTRHSSGFSLRFPRILRLRPDKPLAEIDTLARVEEIYESQVDKPADKAIEEG